MILESRNCIAFDQVATHTEHTGWNVSDGTTILWQADLLKSGEKDMTFEDTMGALVP